MFKNLDIVTLLMITARISPIIFVSMYTWDTAVHQSLNGVMFLGGLFFIISIMHIFGSIFSTSSITWISNLFDNKTSTHSQNATCNILSIGENGRFSSIPLSILTISYLFGTLLYSTIKNNLVRQNTFIYVIFPILILYLVFFERRNNCSTLFSAIIAIIFGGGFGAGYFAGLDELKVLNLDRPNIFYVNAWNY